MKKLKNPLGIVLLAAIFAFSFAACDNPADPPPPVPPKDFAGTVSISVDGDPDPIKVGMTLKAVYSGEETVTKTYTWFEAGVQVATGIQFIPQVEGDYTVTMSAAGYNPISSEPVTVEDDGLEKFDGEFTITSNDSVVSSVEWGTTLTAVYDGTATTVTKTYQWYKDDVAIPAATGVAYTTPLGTGSYYVIVGADDDSYTKKQSKNTVTVTLKTLAGTVGISPSGTVAVNTPLTAGYEGSEDVTETYQWYKNSTPIEGETNATYTPVEAGTYYVIVSVPGYNPKPSSTVTVSPTGGPTKTLVITMPAEIFMQGQTGFMIGLFPEGTTVEQAFAPNAAPIAFANGDDYSGTTTITLTLSLYTIGGTPWTGSGTWDVIGALGDEDNGAETIHFYKYGSVNFNNNDTPITINSTHEEFPDFGGPTPVTNTLEITMLNDIFAQAAEGFMVMLFAAGTVTPEEVMDENTVPVASAFEGEIIPGDPASTLTVTLNEGKTVNTPWTGSGTYDVFGVLFSADGPPRIYKAGSVLFNKLLTPIEITAENEVLLDDGGPGPGTDY